MSGTKKDQEIPRRIVRAVATVLLAGTIVLGGTRAVGDLLNGRVRSAPQVTVSSEPAPSPEQQVAAQQATPPAPAQVVVTQEEAQSTVKAWFAALSASDYGRAEGLTSGDAAVETRQLSDTITGEASRQGVQAQAEVRRLDLSAASQPAATQPQVGQAVRADFEIAINAIVNSIIGQVSVPAQQLQGNATFVVERVDGQVKIIDIREVSGLPGQ